MDLTVFTGKQTEKEFNERHPDALRAGRITSRA
jgi:hypothetical protein